MFPFGEEFILLLFRPSYFTLSQIGVLIEFPLSSSCLFVFVDIQNKGNKRRGRSARGSAGYCHFVGGEEDTSGHGAFPAVTIVGHVDAHQSRRGQVRAGQ